MNPELPRRGTCKYSLQGSFLQMNHINFCGALLLIIHLVVDTITQQTLDYTMAWRQAGHFILAWQYKCMYRFEITSYDICHIKQKSWIYFSFRMYIKYMPYFLIIEGHESLVEIAAELKLLIIQENIFLFYNTLLSSWKAITSLVMSHETLCCRRQVDEKRLSCSWDLL